MVSPIEDLLSHITNDLNKIKQKFLRTLIQSAPHNTTLHNFVTPPLISKISFSLVSWHVQLSRKKEILEIGAGVTKLFPLHRRSHFGVYLSSEELILKFIWLHYKDIRCSTWVSHLNIIWESFMLYQLFLKIAHYWTQIWEFVSTFCLWTPPGLSCWESMPG